jgi:hypothetical protein
LLSVISSLQAIQDSRGRFYRLLGDLQGLPYERRRPVGVAPTVESRDRLPLFDPISHLHQHLDAGTWVYLVALLLAPGA